MRTLVLPAVRGSVIFQLLNEKFSYGSETVTHTINVSALDAQDIGEGVCDVLNLQQKDMME